MPFVLTSDQLQAYRRDGLLFPLAALDGQELAYFRAAHDELDRRLGGSPKAQLKGDLHLHYKWVCDLATHPKILDAVEDIIGRDIMIHSSTFFAKYPRDAKFVSWHQDSHYWRLSEPRLVSAWVALTDSTIENGCLRVLPGTHTRRFPHLERRDKNNVLGKGLTVAETLDEDRAVNIELKAGEMSLHHADIIHGSSPNVTSEPRIGFAIRYVSTAVKQEQGHHAVILARGSDDYRHYSIQARPTADLDQGLVAHRRFDADRQNKA